MRPLVLAGLLLIAIGVSAFAYQGVSYLARERGGDARPVQLRVTQENAIPLPPVVGAICMLTGIVFLLVGAQSPIPPSSGRVETNRRACAPPFGTG
jgi:hypothetical protein